MKYVKINNSKNEKRLAVFISILFSLLLFVGHYANFTGKGVRGFAFLLVGLLAGFLLLYLSINILMYILKSWDSCGERKSCSEWKIFLIIFIICLICWLPYFLAFYPGIITWDSEFQLEQVLGLRELNNQQPLIHTLFIRLCYRIGTALIGNPNGGAACYIIVQMLIMSCIYSYVITQFYRIGLKKWCIFLCVLYYAVMPFNAMYSVTMWKDVIMGGIVLLFSTLLWRIGENDNIRIWNWIFLCISGILMCLLRTNGFYAYLICIPLMIIFMKKYRKQMIIACVCTLLPTMIVKGPVMNKVGIEQSDAIEALSIPAQHIARVIVDGGRLTKEQEDLLSNVVDIDRIEETYTAHISDPIKTLVREKNNQDYITTHKSEFLKLWFELGCKYPYEYLKAQIDQTRGFWSPGVKYWVTATEVKENTFGVVRDSKLPAGLVDKVFMNLESVLKGIPILGWLWTIGIYTCIMLFMLFWSIYRRLNILPFIPVAAILLSLMAATPVFAEFRYVYSLIVTVPLYVVIGTKQEGSSYYLMNQKI